MLAEVTVAGLAEREFLHAIEEQLREGNADAAAATLRSLLPEVAGEGLPLPAGFLTLTSADIVIEGWEMFGDRLTVHDRPQRPITAIAIDISWPGHLGIEPDDAGMLDPIMETSYFSDAAYPFSQCDRAQILAGYGESGSRWHGAFEEIDDTIEVRGIAHFYGAVVNLENHIARSIDVTEGDRLAYLLGAAYIAVILHQAVRDMALRRCLPRPLAVFVGSNEAYPYFDAPVIAPRTPNTEVEDVEAGPIGIAQAPVLATKAPPVRAEADGTGEPQTVELNEAPLPDLPDTAIAVEDAVAADALEETKGKATRKPRKTKSLVQMASPAKSSKVTAVPAPDSADNVFAIQPDIIQRDMATPFTDDASVSSETGQDDEPFKIVAWQIQPDRPVFAAAPPPPLPPVTAAVEYPVEGMAGSGMDADPANDRPEPESTPDAASAEPEYASLTSAIRVKRDRPYTAFDSPENHAASPADMGWAELDRAGMDDPARARADMDPLDGGPNAEPGADWAANMPAPRFTAQDDIASAPADPALAPAVPDFGLAPQDFAPADLAFADEAKPLSSYSLLAEAAPAPIPGGEAQEQNWASSMLEASGASDPHGEDLHLPPPDIHITGKQLRARFVTSESILETQAPRPSFLSRLLGRK